MKAKTFLVLFSILVVLVLVTYMTVDFNMPAPEQSPMGQQLFSDLPVNSIAAIELMHSGGTVSLKKENDIWVVVDRSGFPADVEKISDLVKKVIDMRSGSRFEISPDALNQLMLHDPSATDVPENQKGLRIVFYDENYQSLFDIIIGKVRDATAVHGSYILPKESRVGYLVGGDFRRFGRLPADWIQNKVLDVKPEEIERVVCDEDGRVLYTLHRPEPNEDPVWIGADPDIPQRTYRFDSVFLALINLVVDDVVQVGALETSGFGNQPRLAYYLYDGTVYYIYPGEPLQGADDQFYFRIEVAQPPQEKIFPNHTDEFDVDAVSPEARTGGFKAIVEPWVYVVPAWKHSSFITNPAEFVQIAE